MSHRQAKVSAKGASTAIALYRNGTRNSAIGAIADHLWTAGKGQ
jgi:hypothetical protein